MFIPSVKLIAWTQLRRSEADTLAQEAAGVLESAALDEIKEAWLKGELAPKRNQTNPAALPKVETEPTQQIEQLLAEVDELLAEEPNQQEAGQVPELGEIPKCFEGPRKLIHSQNLGKALKKYAEARGLTLDALIKEMGWPKGTSSLRSVLNKKGSVDTKYADYFVSLLGAGVMG